MQCSMLSVVFSLFAVSCLQYYRNNLSMCSDFLNNFYLGLIQLSFWVYYQTSVCHDVIPCSFCQCTHTNTHNTHTHTFIHSYIHTHPYVHSICIQLFSLPNKIRNCFSITKTIWFIHLGNNCCSVLRIVWSS